MGFPGVGPTIPGGGTTGQLLAKNSATSFDAGWVTASLSGSSLTKIASVSLTTTAATIDFTSIPNTYKTLIIDASVRGTSGNASDIVRLRMNSIDSAGGYMYLWHQLVSTTASPNATSSTNADHIPIGHMTGTSTAGLSYIQTHIGHYAQIGIPSLLTNRAVQSRCTFMHGGTAANWMIGEYDGAYVWDNVAINQVTLIPAAGSFAASSMATLYGLGDALTTTPVTRTLVTKTANYTANDTDYYVWCDTTSGAITVGLPSASGRTGRELVVKDWKGTSATNNIIIDPAGSETIDGSTTKTLNTAYASLTVCSDGTNWGIV